MPRFWLLTSPRTASDDQGVRPAFHGGYFFFPNPSLRFILLSKPMDEWAVQEKAGLAKKYQGGLDEFENHVGEAAKED
jgi:hypothetical protein